MFYLILATALETIADVLFKKQMFWPGMTVFILGTVIWAKYLENTETLSRAVILFAMINLLTVVLAGIFYFKDAITTKLLLSLVFALLAIFFAQ